MQINYISFHRSLPVPGCGRSGILARGPVVLHMKRSRDTNISNISLRCKLNLYFLERQMTRSKTVQPPQDDVVGHLDRGKLESKACVAVALNAAHQPVLYGLAVGQTE